MKPCKGCSKMLHASHICSNSMCGPCCSIYPSEPCILPEHATAKQNIDGQLVMSILKRVFSLVFQPIFLPPIAEYAVFPTPTLDQVATSLKRIPEGRSKLAALVLSVLCRNLPASLTAGDAGSQFLVDSVNFFIEGDRLAKLFSTVIMSESEWKYMSPSDFFYLVLIRLQTDLPKDPGLRKLVPVWLDGLFEPVFAAFIRDVETLPGWRHMELLSSLASETLPYDSPPTNTSQQVAPSPMTEGPPVATTVVSSPSLPQFIYRGDMEVLQVLASRASENFSDCTPGSDGSVRSVPADSATEVPLTATSLPKSASMPQIVITSDVGLNTLYNGSPREQNAAKRKARRLSKLQQSQASHSENQYNHLDLPPPSAVLQPPTEDTPTAKSAPRIARSSLGAIDTNTPVCEKRLRDEGSEGPEKRQKVNKMAISYILNPLMA